MPIRVRPWNAPEKAITAARLVWARAIFTAFSTASAPVVRKMVFFGKSPGVMSFSRSARRIYCSYGFTWKQVWVNLPSCSVTAATTFGWQWPVFSTAMPPAKSIRRCPRRR